MLALDGLNLDLFQGEVLGLLGHNGAGKTTAIRLMDGVLAPSAGTVRTFGRDPMVDGPAVRRRTGVLTETPSLDERLSARENLAFFGALQGLPADVADYRGQELLGLFHLQERADERVGGFSKGMKQRLALARTLLHAPDLLLLDEPTAGLDPVSAREVRRLVARLSAQEGRTVVLCTHDLHEAERLCDRVAVLERGRLLAAGTTAALAARYAARRPVRLAYHPEDEETLRLVLDAWPGVEAERLPVAADGAKRISLRGLEQERLPALVADLAGAGLRLYELGREAATLEDVYFALHDKAGAGRESAA